MSDLIQRLREALGGELGNSAADALEAKDAEIARLKEHGEALHIVVLERAKYKALCNQLGNAMELHGSPFLHHELRYEEALTAWRQLK